MDAQELCYSDNFFTHSFMNIGIFLLPDPVRGAAEICRTLKPGGVTVISSIKKVGWVRIFQAAQKEVKPEATVWKGPLKDEWSTEQKLKSVVQAGGFKHENIDVITAESSLPKNMLCNLLDSMKDQVVLMITKDWSEVEKQKFDLVLEEQLLKELTSPHESEIVAWVALVRK